MEVQVAAIPPAAMRPAVMRPAAMRPAATRAIPILLVERNRIRTLTAPRRVLAAPIGRPTLR